MAYRLAIRSAFLVAASCLLSAPASATVVLNTFTGVIGTSDGQGNVTTDDTNNNFGGGSLIGKPFTLVTSVDTSPGTSFFTGASDFGSFFYFPPNPMTTTLTVNGQTFNFDTSISPYILNSDGFTSAGPGGETFLQAFFSSGQFQVQGFYLDIVSNVNSPADFNSPFPSMLAGNGDFTVLGASFYDQTNLFTQPVETEVLDITAINSVAGAVPEPSTWAMMLIGFAGLGFLAHHRRRQTKMA